MDFSDDELGAEAQRLDPKDTFGALSLAATLFNIVYSVFNSLYTFDWLISSSLILGVLSIANRNRLVPKISLALLAIHLGTIAVIKMAR